ncbi:hypothetical protein [Streptomyces decoyicus]|uniref:hypothetical protein n=1 Tax=Streptomyces decoyicus TaxID=249567 RepID=UPI002E16BE81|nr:hypothetical protein OG532_26995 [Streptomyces decoyicus]
MSFPAAGKHGLILIGVQFPPELTPEVLQAWFDEDGETIAAEVGADPARLVAELRADLPAVRQRARALGGHIP